MAKMRKEYERLLRSGEYMDENEMCNDLGLNYDDLYEDERDDEDEREQRNSRNNGSNNRRRK